MDDDLPVNIVSNGREAIDYLEHESAPEELPCLLILDTNMPIMNGWEFLDAYGQQFTTDFKKNFVIVMLTALDTKETTEMALANPNVSDTAQKPLSDLKFKEIIKKHFS